MRSEFTRTELMKDPKDYIEYEDFVKLYRSIQNPRDKMLVYALFWSGRRVSELLQLRVGDIDFKRNEIMYTILKKRKPARVPVSAPKNLIQKLKEYITNNGIDNDPNALLFPSPYKPSKPLTRQQVDVILKKYSKEFGIYTKAGNPLHAHAFRHGLAIFLGERARTPQDAKLIQDILQHSNVSLTMYYVSRFNKELRIFLDNVIKDIEES